MSKQISTTINTALQAEEISTRMLLELYLKTSDIPSITLNTISTQFSIENGYVVFRFVANDNQDLIIPSACTNTAFRGKTYISAEIERGTIDTATDGRVEKTSVKMSNKYQEWAAIFASLGNVMNNRKCIVYEYFPDYPSEPPINVFDGVINGVRMTASQFEWEIRRSVVDFSIDSPNMTYDVNCQWQFKDVRCGYNGSLVIKCDKTINTCCSLNNVLNFGGHPSVPREMVIRSN